MNIPAKATSYSKYNARDEMVRVDALVDVVTELTIRLTSAELGLVDANNKLAALKPAKKAATSE